MRPLSRAVAAAVLIATATVAAAQTPTPGSPKPPAETKTKAKAKKGPPLDFTGVWELDAKASRGVSKNMEGAVLSVRQNGNRIWIEPIEAKRSAILSEEIIVDGKQYEKATGRGDKGTLEAAWGKDGSSLWLQIIVATDENPTAATQRMIWRLQDGGKTWTRQTRTIQVDSVKDTFLVFRKRQRK